MKKVDIRGISLWVAKDQTEFVNFLLDPTACKTGKLIALNAEKTVLAGENAQVKTILNQAEFVYADGISVVKAIHKKYPEHRSIERIAGADLWLALMEKAAEIGLPVFLIGGEEAVISQVEQRLTQRGVKIVGVQNGYFQVEDEDALIEKVKQSGAKLITIALGSPKQEILMQKLQVAYPDALYMGVGGSYDVFVGKVKRAPKSWQLLGLEWLYRLIQQPTRWQRQLRLVKFAYYYLTNKL